MAVKSRVAIGSGEVASKSSIPKYWAIFLCLGSFLAGMFFTNRTWKMQEQLNLESRDCDMKLKGSYHQQNKASKAQFDIQALDNKISSLEMKLAVAKAEHQLLSDDIPPSRNSKRRYFMVIGINTAFSSRKRRDSVRTTWMPQGEKKKKLEKEKGIIIRFIIGHSSTAGGILDRAIESEEMECGDFLRLEHIEG